MNCIRHFRSMSPQSTSLPSTTLVHTYSQSHQKLVSSSRGWRQLCQRQFQLQVRRRQHSSASITRSLTNKPSHRRESGDNTSGNVPPHVIFGFGVPFAGLTAASIYAYYSCLDNVPYTNRSRLLATSPEWEANMGDDQYKALLKQHQGEILPKDHRAYVTVQRVGSRIAAAAKQCSREWSPDKEQSKSMSPYTYTVVRSEDANAFVLPGNHVFVLTGLFKYAHNEDELAGVLGHEMAHNLARHAGERVSESILMSVLRRLAIVFDPSGTLFALLIPATLLYSLPHSREHEVEADRIGIILASEACYDPLAAKNVFSRMKEDSENRNGGQAPPPEFISTHPGYDTRLSFFDRWMPDALERFNKDGGNKCRAIREEMKRARRLAAEMHDGREGRRR